MLTGRTITLLSLYFDFYMSVHVYLLKSLGKKKLSHREVDGQNNKFTSIYVYMCTYLCKLVWTLGKKNLKNCLRGWRRAEIRLYFDLYVCVSVYVYVYIGMKIWKVRAEVWLYFFVYVYVNICVYIYVYIYIATNSWKQIIFLVSGGGRRAGQSLYSENSHGYMHTYLCILSRTPDKQQE